ncbi:hypothetical protein DFJ73DRAFT_960902, partial [Zopfochytrium polystomum]
MTPRNKMDYLRGVIESEDRDTVNECLSRPPAGIPSVLSTSTTASAPIAIPIAPTKSPNPSCATPPPSSGTTGDEWLVSSAATLSVSADSAPLHSQGRAEKVSGLSSSPQNYRSRRSPHQNIFSPSSTFSSSPSHGHPPALRSHPLPKHPSGDVSPSVLSLTEAYVFPQGLERDQSHKGSSRSKGSPARPAHNVAAQTENKGDDTRTGPSSYQSIGALALSEPDAAFGFFEYDQTGTHLDKNFDSSHIFALSESVQRTKSSMDAASRGERQSNAFSSQPSPSSNPELENFRENLTSRSSTRSSAVITHSNVFFRTVSQESFESTSSAFSGTSVTSHRGRASFSAENDVNLDSSVDSLPIRTSRRTDLRERDRKLRQGRLLLVSLLENFCMLYDQSPERNRRLFFLLCKQLSAMGIIDSDDFIDEISAVRGSYKRAFRDLVVQAMEAIRQEQSSTVRQLTAADSSVSGDDGEHDGQRHLTIVRRFNANLIGAQSYAASRSSRLPPHDLPLNGRIRRYDSSETPAHVNQAVSFANVRENQTARDISEILDLHASRYREDFEEVRVLGKGAFGKVWCARNRLDGVQYAVKTVRLRGHRPGDLEKILREVKVQARLSHANVVRYFSCWLEHAHSCEDDEDDEVTDDYAEDDIEIGDEDCRSNGAQTSLDFASSSAVAQDYETNADLDFGNIEFFDSSKNEGREISQHSSLAESISLHTASTDLNRKFLNRGGGRHRVLRESTSPPGNGKSSVARGVSRELTLFIQMELCGQTLLDFLNQRSNFAVPLEDGMDSVDGNHVSYVDSALCFGVLTDVCEGLAYIHSQSCIHRDIAPKNLFYVVDPHMPTYQPPISASTNTPSSLPDSISPLSTVNGSFSSAGPAFLGRAKPSYASTSAAFSTKAFASGAWWYAPGGRWKIGDFGLVTAGDDDVISGSTDEMSSGIAGTDNGDAPSASSFSNGAPLATTSTPVAGRIPRRRRTTGVGTMTYASPEQLAPGRGLVPYTSRSDMYSFGILMFELLHEPFGTGMERAGVLRGLRYGVLPEEFVKRWPKEATIILWLMSSDPMKRPSARELLDLGILRRWQESMQSSRAPSSVSSSSVINIARSASDPFQPLLHRKDGVTQTLTEDVPKVSSPDFRMVGQEAPRSNKGGTGGVVQRIASAIVSVADRLTHHHHNGQNTAAATATSSSKANGRASESKETPAVPVAGSLDDGDYKYERAPRFVLVVTQSERTNSDARRGRHECERRCDGRNGNRIESGAKEYPVRMSSAAAAAGAADAGAAELAATAINPVRVDLADDCELLAALRAFPSLCALHHSRMPHGSVAAAPVESIAALLTLLPAAAARTSSVAHLCIQQHVPTRLAKTYPPHAALDNPELVPQGIPDVLSTLVSAAEFRPLTVRLRSLYVEGLLTVPTEKWDRTEEVQETLPREVLLALPTAFPNLQRLRVSIRSAKRKTNQEAAVVAILSLPELSEVYGTITDSSFGLFEALLTAAATRGSTVKPI